MEKPIKPLGGKSYGSIPHLLGSKLGEGDHHVHEGQHRICTEKTRDKYDLIIVQEKYDGSNVGVANINGKIVALTRAGYTAESSPYIQHHYFAKWVEKNRSRFAAMLPEGVRVCGEWLLQAHGLKYIIPKEPFVAFDIIEGKDRLTYGQFSDIAEDYGFSVPTPIHFSCSAIGVNTAMTDCLLKSLLFGLRTTNEAPEGLVYRVERKGKVDFLAKWVRPDFVPGKFLPEISGQPEVWNFDISKLTA